MKTSVKSKKSLLLFVSRIVRPRMGLFLLISVSCLQFTTSKAQTCSSCCLPSFPELTVYQVVQTGHGLGFGVEAGNWNKDAGKFSYFIGTSMVWADGTQATEKTSGSQKQLFLSLYVKGQYKLTNHLYAIAAPGIVNLTYVELQTGLRYVVPITRTVGIGIEPAYAFNQKQFVLNANVHFALR